MAAGEFDLIARYLAPLSANAPLAYKLTDDAALLDPPPGEQLVLTKDCMVAGVHFLPTDPPELIARKLVRTNLSDLAAMGARPLGYLLGTAWPKDLAEETVARFAAGLALDQEEFGWTLLGGDTVATSGPMTLSLTAIGAVPTGQALRRNGAQLGDRLWVSGTIGDAALGLDLVVNGGFGASDTARMFLIDRLRCPTPRLALGQALRGLAHGCLDISDGLVQDVGHLATRGGVRAVIDAGNVPLSAAAAEQIGNDPTLFERVLTGGDDYELAFTATPDRDDAVRAAAQRVGVPVTVIGRIEAGQGVQVVDRNGAPIELAQSGYRHF